MIVRQKYGGSPWLYDEAGDIVGIKSPDGTELIFSASQGQSSDSTAAWMMLQSDYELGKNTNIQKLFDVGSAGNGSFDVVTGIYEYSGIFYLGGLSSTAIGDRFTFAGSSTIGKIIAALHGADRTAPENPQSSTDGQTYHTANNEMLFAPAGSGTNVSAKVSGIIDITGDGTLIPSIKLGFAPTTTPYVKSPSWFRIRRLGDTGETYGGLVI